LPRLPPPTCARPVSGVGLGPRCYTASLLWFPGPCPSPVFRSAICDCSSLNVSGLSFSHCAGLRRPCMPCATCKIPLHFDEPPPHLDVPRCTAAYGSLVPGSPEFDYYCGPDYILSLESSICQRAEIQRDFSVFLTASASHASRDHFGSTQRAPPDRLKLLARGDRWRSTVFQVWSPPLLHTCPMRPRLAARRAKES
jgi:hypothetical protein